MKISNILDNIKQSCVSVDYYKQILKEPLSKSVITLFFTLISLGIFSGIYFSTIQLPKITTQMEAISRDIVTNYPDDLIIKVTNHTMNLSRESFIVPFSNVISEKYKSSFPFENFAYLTDETLTLDTISEHTGKYFIIASPQKIFLADPSTPKSWQEYEIEQILTDNEEIAITKQTVRFVGFEFITQLQENKLEIQLVSGLAKTFLYIIAKLWFLIIETLLVFLIFKLYSIRLTFKQIVKITMNVLIPVSIVTFITSALYPNNAIPMQTITFWVIIFYILLNLKQKKR